MCPYKCSFKPSEGKDRTYNRIRKRESDQALIDKLPNEFRHAFNDYSTGSSFTNTDENKYYLT